MPRSSSGSARRTQGVLGGRSEHVVQRVLDAGLAELAHSGYAAFRMDEVASRAGVNKTTIYRRWPTRADLITAIVARMRASLDETPLPNTGELERDLIEAFGRRHAFARRVEGRAWTRLLDERRTREVEAIIGDAIDRRHDEWRTLITRAITRGELPKRTDPQLVLDLIRALADSRRPWLTLAVRTILSAAHSGLLVSIPARAKRRAPRSNAR